MKNSEIIRRCEELLLPLLENTGIEIYDIEFVKEGAERIVRIYIDKKEGIGINDCEFVSRAIEKVLDREDFIKTAYVLEVSSPGTERRPRRENLDKSNKEE